MKRIFIVFMLLSILLVQLGCIMPVSASLAPSGDVVYVNEDFSNGYQLETAYTYDEIAEVNSDFGYTPEGWNKSSAEFFKVKKVDVNNPDKGNYLEIGLQGSGKHAYLASEIGDFETGTLVSEMKIRISGARYTSDVFVFFDANDGYKAALGATNSTDISIARSALNRLFNTNIGNLTKDSGNFYNLRCVWSRESANSPWSVYVYDMWTGELAYKNENVDAGYTPSAVMFYSSYYTASTDSAEDTIDLASLKVYKLGTVSLSANGCYNVPDKTVSFTPSKPLNATSVENATVVIKDSTGAQVTTGTAEYVGENVVLTTDLRLTGVEYTASFTGLVDSKGFASETVNVDFAINTKMDRILANEDFRSSAYAVGTTYNKEELMRINPDLVYDGTVAENAKIYEIKQQSETKYLAIASPTSGAVNVFSAPFESIKTGTLVVEVKILDDTALTGTNRTIYYGNIMRSGTSTVAAGDVAYMIETGSNNIPTSSYGMGRYNLKKNALAKDGYYNLRVVISRESVSEPWSAELQDMNQDDYVIKSVAGINNESNAAFGADFDAEQILFTRSYGVNTSKTINVAGFKAYIPADKETVKLSEVEFTSGGEVVEELDFVATDLTAKFTIMDTKAQEKSYTVFLAVYNSDGRLVDVTSASGTTSGEEKPITLSLENFVLTSGAYAKVICLNNTNELVPYGAAEVLPPKGFPQAD